MGRPRKTDRPRPPRYTPENRRPAHADTLTPEALAELLLDRAEHGWKFGGEYYRSSHEAEIDRQAAALLSEITTLRARMEELEKGVEAWREVAQDYTPGGSEFTTPAECAAYVRQVRDRQFETIKCFARERKAAETALAAEKARAERLEAALRPFAECRPDDILRDSDWTDIFIRAGDFRRAARALSDKGGDRG